MPPEFTNGRLYRSSCDDLSTNDGSERDWDDERAAVVKFRPEDDDEDLDREVRNGTWRERLRAEAKALADSLVNDFEWCRVSNQNQMLFIY